MKKYKHLFFDLDGTLWDLKRNTAIALEKLFSDYAHQGLNADDYDYFFARYHFHNDQAWALYREGKMAKEELRTIRFRRAFADINIHWDDALLEKFADDFLDLGPRQPHTLPGTHALLDYLKPHYKMHIITNGFREVQGIKMEAARLNGYFDQIILSEDAGVRKPNAAIFQYALDRAGAEVEESLMIGDDWEADILGARNFGMDQVYLTATEKMLAEQSGNQFELRHNYKPTYVIDNLEEMMPILRV